MERVTTELAVRSFDADDYEHHRDHVQPSICLGSHPRCMETIEGAVEEAIRACPVQDSEGLTGSVPGSELLRTDFRFPGGICPTCKGTNRIRCGRPRLGTVRQASR